ncbi:DEAD/DEAH box helicase [Chondrinema litorale]|uniref:DEAD/DEAH box helicase n=1 Tax=Chondrinema litorale TaxID=2994555 RepID=UPI002543CBD8|nr:DEAD/DEAH box helicase [Chondrinema litorale]UZR97878.1 DEAD/DEAH box helicase [Chondrinema litorale]
MQIETFEASGLSPEILKALKEIGFEQPTPIQAQTLPHLLSGNQQDLVALAQTGTGKTAAFGLPLVELADPSSKSVQGLVLCPTRELCIQISKDLQSFSKYKKGLNVLPVYGGASITPQIKDLKQGAQLVIGTPGRVIDLMKRKALDIRDISWLVLDEADEMLNMGFKDDLDTILTGASEEKQTLLFSATMPKEIAMISSNYMNNALEISVSKKNTTSSNVNHVFYMVQAKDRYLALKRIADLQPDIYGIIFCRTRRECKEVSEKLMHDGYNADALHGDLSQVQRDYVMNRFRIRNIQLLVATDVAARGLDVNELTHVINYNLPDEAEVYVHRSGRTGRAGNKGTSVSIIHSREMGKIRIIEKKGNFKFERLQVPNGKEICEKQLFSLIDKVEQVSVDGDEIEEFMDVIYKKLSWLERDELIKKFVSIEFNRFLEYYKDAPDLNKNVKEKRERDSSFSDRGDRNGSKGGRRGSNGYKKYSRYFINLGEKNSLNPAKLIGLINKQFRNEKIPVGNIEIMKSFSFFEIDSEFSTSFPESFSNLSYQGIPVNVEPANAKPSGRDSRGGGGGRSRSGNGEGFRKKKFGNSKRKWD